MSLSQLGCQTIYGTPPVAELIRLRGIYLPARGWVILQTRLVGRQLIRCVVQCLHGGSLSSR